MSETAVDVGALRDGQITEEQDFTITYVKLTDIEVLLLTEYFIVVNKHFDVRINSDDSNDKITVETQLCSLYPNLANCQLRHNFRFVHRLDYATSGVLCLALTKKAAKWATKAFMSRSVSKHYLALLRGHVTAIGEEKVLTISVAIGKDKRVDGTRKMCTVESEHCENSQECITTLTVLEYGKYDGQDATKVLLVPKTGRTHQLRVHCLHIGHHIVGDYTYSERLDNKPYRMMLHAHRLVMPLKSAMIDVTAPDPFLNSLDPKWQPVQVFNCIDSL